MLGGGTKDRVFGVVVVALMAVVLVVVWWPEKRSRA
jgi:hypothetical protein